MKLVLRRVRIQRPRQADAMPIMMPQRRPHFSITYTQGKFAGRYNTINEYDIMLTISGDTP